MRIALSKVVVVGGLILSSASLTFAQNEYRRFDISWLTLSYNRQGSENLYGGGLSFATRVNERIGVVADLAVHETAGDPTLTITAYRFGPRFYGPKSGRLSTFGEVLAGGAHLRNESTLMIGDLSGTFGLSANGFALAAGGGVDMDLKDWLAWRVVQVDYSMMRVEGNTSNGVRIGTGLVFRFGK
jgi:hypothetical protein